MSLRNHRIYLALFYYFRQFVFTDCVIGNNIMSDNSIVSVINSGISSETDTVTVA